MALIGILIVLLVLCLIIALLVHMYLKIKLENDKLIGFISKLYCERTNLAIENSRLSKRFEWNTQKALWVK